MTQRPSARTQTSFLFDLDGTLVDSVYDHVIAWHRALQDKGIEVSIWRIHRRIGMSGDLFTAALSRELGHDITEDLRRELSDLHAHHYNTRSTGTVALPGARELLKHLTENEIPWGIATSGRMRTAGPCWKHSALIPPSMWSSPATSCATPSPTPTSSSPAPKSSA
jgi:phosphoglycolate phosphatase-like HAD superfamily hydrolase